ncbi:hypothetical protein [Streptomyces sp. NPDC051364]|uniref:hypothetical protein n=1 Tax=Streptomyces sp. NPDC051364 TaxID=3155799 RepID=UPI0034474C69
MVDAAVWTLIGSLAAAAAVAATPILSQRGDARKQREAARETNVREKINEADNSCKAIVGLLRTYYGRMGDKLTSLEHGLPTSGPLDPTLRSEFDASVAASSASLAPEFDALEGIIDRAQNLLAEFDRAELRVSGEPGQGRIMASATVSMMALVDEARRVRLQCLNAFESRLKN